jgi:putative aldouronate transport system permease protein
LGRILFEFPIPIILALLLNEIRKSATKRFYQTVFTFPHFISWVVAAGMMIDLLSDAGVLNQIIVLFGGQKINLLTDPGLFKALLFLSDNWKEVGWGTIIYLATIAGISPEIYEAAKVDGAKRFQLILHITWPALRYVMGILFILQIANIMNAGFDQIFNMYNPVVYGSSDIIDTYIYRRTFMVGESFSSSTALGVFKSVINVLLLYSANYMVKKINKQGIY